MPLEPLELSGQFFGFACVQAVTHYQHQGAPAYQTARMVLTQCAQRRAEARASGKVLDKGTRGRQHGVRVGEPKGRREIGQLRAESKYIAPHLHTMCLPGRRVQKCQQQTRIALHGAGYVHQQQQRQWLAPELQAAQSHHFAVGAGCFAQGARPVHADAPRACARPARRNLWHG